MAINAWSGSQSPDPADRVAAVAQAKRELLLAVNRAKLPREELEDCFAQATLELVVRARRSPFASDLHAANALEQKLASRITDRIRAVSGRSPIAAILRSAVSLDDQDAENGPLVAVDGTARTEQQTLARHELRALRELAAELTDDQRLVLACQVSLGMDCADFCEHYGWSAEKFRKVAQRARAKLRSLLDAYDQGERCRTLEPALLAVASRVAEPDEERHVREHASNCPGCARTLRDLRAAERGVAAVLPVPAAVVKLGLVAKAGAALLALRRALPFGSPTPGAGEAAGGGAVAGGSLLSVGAAKLGVTALCVAGAAGSYAVCSSLDVLPGAAAKTPHHRATHPAPARATPVLAPMPRGRAGSPAAAPTTPVRAPRKARRTHAVERRSTEFTASHARSAARREFDGASAAAVAPTFESAERPRTTSREFSGEFGP